MKNLLIVGLAALLLFSLSASLSLWLNAPTAADKKKAEDKESTVLPKKDSELGSRPQGVGGRPGEVPSPEFPGAGSTQSSPEEAAQLLSRLRERSATLERREVELKRREDQMRLVMEELRGERAILDALRKQVGDESKATSDRLAQVEKRAAELEDQKTQLARAQTEAQKRQVVVDGLESKNLDRIATISDSMAPESAALIVKQLADSGRMDTAVKMLNQMKERRAAQVLAEINDPPLAAQLLDRMRGLSRPAPTTPREGT